MKCCEVKLGSLKHTAMAQNPTYVADGYGGTVRTFTDFKRVRCFIEQNTANERYAASKIEHIGTHTMIVKDADGITPDMRIAFPIDQNPMSDQPILVDSIVLPITQPAVVSQYYAIDGIIEQDNGYTKFALRLGGAV
jgi:SPP1 family predicted phage head-tail adaptor